MTLFDLLSVACFIGLVVAYFTVGQSDQKLLPHFLMSGIAFAVANQLGNADKALFAILLLLAGAGYAALMVRR